MIFFRLVGGVLGLLLCGGIAVAGPAQEKMLALATTADQYGVVDGKDGWLFLREEIEHLGSPVFFGKGIAQFSRTANPEMADPLPAIVDFNAQLKARGILLVFVPIPPKALIYNEQLPVDVTAAMFAELYRPYQDLFKELTENQVQVVDLVPIFMEKKGNAQLYCKTDTHFSGEGLALVAATLNGIVRQADWYATVPKTQFKQDTKHVQILGDLMAMRKGSDKENLDLQFVSENRSGKAPESDTESPVLLLGDSHTLVFSVGGDLHTTGAGLFDQLSRQVEFPVELLGVRGSGATPSRIKMFQRSQRDREYLAKKKIVFWCLSSRELTGNGGWRQIPVEKRE